MHSSRKFERATYDSVAFRFVAANTHPDHDTLAAFRRRLLTEIEVLFVQVLMLVREMKLLKLGHIALDGTKLEANASKHKALSWGHANKIEGQLRQEVQQMLALAERSDAQAVPDGMDVPAEIARRVDRLKALAQGNDDIVARVGVPRGWRGPLTSPFQPDTPPLLNSLPCTKSGHISLRAAATWLDGHSDHSVPTAAAFTMSDTDHGPQARRNLK